MLAFLNDSTAADCRYEISLSDLEVIDLLSSSFIDFPLLSGVVVVRLHYNGSYRSQILHDESVINSKSKTKKIDSINRKENKLKQSVHTFLHLRFVELKLRIDFLLLT